MGSSIRRPLARAAFLVLALAAGTRVAHAQDANAPIAASVSGKVETPGPKQQLPIAGVMVTLHRVAQDSSGPLDSIRTDAQGRYSLHYRRTVGDNSIYFAATIYSGIAYFSNPIQSTNAVGDEAEITVFDTTSRKVDLHVRGHHVVVSAPRPDGVRDVVEVWELSNDTSVTVVGRDSLAAVWSAPLPGGATTVAGGQGDVSADAIRARGNRVVVLAPFGPGVKQLSYSYSLAPGEFPFDLPVEQPTSVLEVLLEEPAAQVMGASLHATDAAFTSGRAFKRFLGQDVAGGTSLRVTVPVTTAATRTRILAIVASLIALAMVAALARAFTRRGQVPAPVSVPATTATPARRESLLASIAALDTRHERADASLSPSEYEAERSALKAELAALLAAEDSGS